ncbi:hypothetical protein KGY14_00660 [Ameyamaea chiangmaiensis]|uniref:Uncharacterized protein n=1 Tax=Ameyamaea chiangmaiensis TaxID=442969 RepID=A0A850PCY2_9PROT|nr:hypothetical protein [Ameyamaea chiangmaiensis]MBS4073696.1 hypothetical protein [Ameyamaea chiangmaiensis]NVN39812.1 hypothetical protein [Ameyamaea chiangmaiensis]
MTDGVPQGMRRERNVIMTSRFQFALVAGAMLAAGPVVAATHHHGHHDKSAMPSAQASQTDALNDKSLADARASMTPPPQPAAITTGTSLNTAPTTAAGTGMTAPAAASAPMQPSASDMNAPAPQPQ